MTDITADCTFLVMHLGDLKIITCITPAAAASGNKIDLGSDTAAGAKTKKILNTLLQDDLGADKLSTWAQGTGIITLGTITTGIHNLTIVAEGN